jgi:segregation and condensation protein A
MTEPVGDRSGTRTHQPASPPAGRPGLPESDVPDQLTYSVILPEFEGPLDLLLFLCKTHEIDIINIPIAFVTAKYLLYLDLMKTMSVEVAAEYLVMAATLAYLKSRELVPTPEADEADAEAGSDDDGLDPKEALIRRLLEYQKYKNAAAELGARPIEGRNVFGRGMPIDDRAVPGELAEHSPWRLIELFAGILAKAKPQHAHEVVIDRLSVAQRINQLIDRLEAADSFSFDAIVDLHAPAVELRHQVVVTLLAILELAKLRAIRVLQDPASETFFITRSASATPEALAAARQMMTTSDTAEAAAEAEIMQESTPDDGTNEHGQRPERERELEQPRRPQGRDLDSDG